MRMKPPPTPRKPESQPVKRKTPVTVQKEMVMPEAGKWIMGGSCQRFLGSSANAGPGGGGLLGGLGRGPLILGHIIVEHVDAQAEEQDHISIAHYRAGIAIRPGRGLADGAQPHDVAGADLDADDRAHDGQNPSFMSTLPILRCLAVATMDLPKMWARSVPMA